MSASGLQVISHKLSLIMSAMAVIGATSASYMWSDDLKELAHRWIGMPAETLAAAEPHDAVLQKHSGTLMSTVEGAPKATSVLAPAKQSYRVIAILKGPPREAILQSGGIHCIYRLGDSVPGWGVIIAITDRSVLSMKEQLALISDSSGPSHELWHSSSAEPCTSIPQVH